MAIPTRYGGRYKITESTYRTDIEQGIDDMSIPSRYGREMEMLKRVKNMKKKLYRLDTICTVSVPLVGWTRLKSADLLFLYFIRYIISLFSF